MPERRVFVVAVLTLLSVFWALSALAEMVVDTAWVRTYDGEGGYDFAEAIAVDASGNVYVAGMTADSTFSFDYATVKYYPNGDTAWVRTYNGPEVNLEVAEAITVDDYGNVYVTGVGFNSVSLGDFVTVKYVQTGLWRGDANSDGTIDLGDIVHLINYLYKNGPAPDPLTVADCNCDETVELGDVIHLINYLFKDGPPPDCWQ